LASAERLIFRWFAIGRVADDKRSPQVYRLLVLTLRDVRLGARRDPRTVDLAVAAVLTVVAQLEVWLGKGDPADQHRVVAAAVSLLATGAVALRRRWPFTIGVVVAWAFALQLAFAGDPQIIAASIGWFCALYGMTVWTSTRGFVLGMALLVLSFGFTLAAPEGPAADSVVLFALVTVIVMLLVRRVVGDRDRRVQLAERERDVAAREAVVEERARIARELHDAIAHNVSTMVVQAGAERRLLNGSDGSTREVLETIEHVGRGALTEMRRLVGMLRSENGDPLAPQPGLDDLATLATQVREAGLPVELFVEGERRELSVGIELSAYRIVQEALTNALKHAGDARATVHVRYRDDSLELEIADDGASGADAAALASGGHGLVGMRERVALYGGRFDAGRSPSGGFRVRALLPIR
jgi:signal transduction histidine kinase